MDAYALAHASLGADQPARVKTAAGVRSLVTKALNDQQGKAKLYRAIADSYDRMPPDSIEDLEADGLGWTTNVDWGGLEAGIDETAESVLNLITEPSPLIRFCSDADIPDKAKLLADVETAYSKCLKKWVEYEDVNALLAHYISAYGVGLPYFPHPNSWHFQALHPVKVALPVNAKTNPDTWPWLGIATTFCLTDLIQVLKAGETAEKQGWDIKAIKAVIEQWNTTHGEQTFGQETAAEQIAHALDASGDQLFADESLNVRVFVVYVKEFDDKISEYYLADFPESDFLFKREKEYDSMADLLPIIPLSLGDGEFHKLRGYGQKALPYHNTENRMLNHACDVATLSSNIAFQTDEDVVQRLPELVFGPITLLPEDWDIPQAQIQNVSGQLLELRELFRNQRAANNKAFGGSIDRTQRTDQSATAARLEYQENSSLRDSQVSRIYRRMTMFHRALWKRFNGKMTSRDKGYKLREEFRKKVAALGADQEFLNTLEVEAARTIFGDGDPRNIFLALMDLMPFVGFMSEGGKRKFAEWVLKARLRNTDMVSDFLGEPEMDDYDTMQRKWAQLENVAFQTSEVMITPGPTDNDMIHAGEHTVFAEDTIRQVEEGAIPMEQGFTTLLKYQEHMTEGQDGVGHLPRLQQDPLAKPVYEDAYNRYQAILNTIRRYEQMLQAKREKEQADALEAMRNPPPDPASEAAAQTELKKQELMERETMSKIEREDRTAAAEIEREDFKARMAANREAGKVTDLKEIPRGGE